MTFASGNGSRFFFCLKAKVITVMRNKKPIRMSCVDAKKVEIFFSKLSQSITSGCEKVWVRRESNGEMSFIVDNEAIRISVSSMEKGGIL